MEDLPDSYTMKRAREIRKDYTGHKHGGSDQESYGGVYEGFVCQELNKMEHPWLKYKSKQINYEL